MLYRNRFLAIYAGLTLIVVAAIAAAIVLAFTPLAGVAHKSDLGPTTSPALIALAEKTLAQSAASQGVTVLSQKVVSITRPNANTIVIRVAVKTAEAGSVTLDVTLSRGIYSVADVEVAPKA